MILAPHRSASSVEGRLFCKRRVGGSNPSSGSANSKFQSQANAHCAAANQHPSMAAAGMKRALVGSPRGGVRLQRLSMDVTGGESAATQFSSGRAIVRKPYPHHYKPES